MSLPWSTSATGILLVLWLIAVLPTLDLAAVRREVMTPAGGLPVLFWAFAALGMLWADVEWRERIAGLGAFHKLLIIPLLLAQFRRSGRAHWVVLGFLASSALLLVFSFALALLPGLTWRGKTSIGVPFKDYIAQSGVFALCALGLLGTGDRILAGPPRAAGAAAGGGGRAVRGQHPLCRDRTNHPDRGCGAVRAAGLPAFRRQGLARRVPDRRLVAGLSWASSPYLRLRVDQAFQEVVDYRERGEPTSAGQRLQFWRQSADFVAESPVLGHGTGTIETLFRRAATEPGRAGHRQSAQPGVRRGGATRDRRRGAALCHVARASGACSLRRRRWRGSD